LAELAVKAGAQVVELDTLARAPVA